MSSIPSGDSPAERNFVGSYLFMRTWFDVSDQIRRGNTYGEGSFFFFFGGGSKLRHCIVHKFVARFAGNS